YPGAEEPRDHTQGASACFRTGEPRGTTSKKLLILKMLFDGRTALQCKILFLKLVTVEYYLELGRIGVQENETSVGG
ncbi:unnamed protein product, partial [Timema podura]|nr:unnamed protein product [Timema podura]